jgi:hypothetical protein
MDNIQQIEQLYLRMLEKKKKEDIEMYEHIITADDEFIHH